GLVRLGGGGGGGGGGQGGWGAGAARLGLSRGRSKAGRIRQRYRHAVADAARGNRGSQRSGAARPGKFVAASMRADLQRSTVAGFAPLHLGQSSAAWTKR